eukprot:TRINITY_DN31099_c0_g1_i1.p1 TRINITY_DN31099_c0_g1~~TRINITY_DN31099_c0_g1_i1.p1  ORF type:complete len:1152 (+),score=331.94 TRINITY_DN31099_c0_g1_i1:70-3525(+)
MLLASPYRPGVPDRKPASPLPRDRKVPLRCLEAPCTALVRSGSCPSIALSEPSTRASTSDLLKTSSSFGQCKSLASDREVEVLVQQIRSLCRDRRDIRQEMEETDERCRASAIHLRSHLTDAQARFETVRCEHTRLKSLLREARAEISTCEHPAVQHLDAAAEQEVKCLQTRVDGLEAGRNLVSQHLASMQEEVASYQRKIEELCREQRKAGKEVVLAVDNRSSAEGELQIVQNFMRQSFSETAELQEKFAAVDERFEKVMTAVDKESVQTVGSLKEDIRVARRQSEKVKRRTEETKALLAEKQAEASQQAASLKSKQEEIRKLQEACEEARLNTWKRDEEFIEVQRKSMLDQSQEMQKLGGMMSLQSHDRIMKEQSDYYQRALRDLEEAMDHQAKRHAEATRRMREGRAAYEQEQIVQRQEVMVATLMAEQDAIRAELEEVERKEMEEAELCRLLHEQIKAAKPAADQAERSAQVVEEQRGMLARDLELATSRLALLKDVLMGERRASMKARQAQKSLEEMRAACAITDEKLANQQFSEAQLNALTATCQELEASLSRQRQQLVELQAFVTESQEQDDKMATDLANKRACVPDAERQLQDALQRAAYLEEARKRNVATSRKRDTVAKQLQVLLEEHAHEGRSALAKLRWETREEQRCLAVQLEGAATRWIQAVEKDFKHLVEHQKKRLKDSDDAKEAARVLEGQVRSKLAATKCLETKSSHCAKVVWSCKSDVEEQRALTELAYCNVDRVVAALGTVLPSGLPETARQLLQAGSLSGELAPAREITGEMLEALDAELRSALTAARASGAEEERQRSALQTAQAMAQTGVDAATRLAEAVEKRAVAGARVAELSANMAALAVEASGADAASSAKVLQAEKQLLTLGRRLTAVEAEGEDAAQRVSVLKAQLASQAAEVAAAAEKAVLEACRPLEEAITKASGEKAILQQRLPAEYASLEETCKERLRAGERRLRAELEDKQRRIQQKVDDLRADSSKMQLAKLESLAARQSAHLNLQSQLDRLTEELATARKQVQEFQEVRSCKERGAEKHRDTMWDTERQLTDLAELKSRELRQGEDEKRELARQHSKAVSQLKLQLADDLRQLRTSAASAAGALTDELTGEMDDVLRTHLELESKTASLLARAKGELGGA